MSEVDIKRLSSGEESLFQVTVSEGGTQISHKVELGKEDYERLSGGRVTPEELVRESFYFLLEREPKESILSEFDIMLINSYFPEYEREIEKRLHAV